MSLRAFAAERCNSRNRTCEPIAGLKTGHYYGNHGDLKVAATRGARFGKRLLQNRA
jgi:hypothetical protein